MYNYIENMYCTQGALNDRMATEHRSCCYYYNSSGQCRNRVCVKVMLFLPTQSKRKMLKCGIFFATLRMSGTTATNSGGWTLLVKETARAHQPMLTAMSTSSYKHSPLLICSQMSKMLPSKSYIVQHPCMDEAHFTCGSGEMSSE